MMMLMGGSSAEALAATHDARGAAPKLMLANVWRPGLPLSAYWVSEKYDGVRGYWDGRQLWTRRGGLVRAPAWFTAGWSQKPMDGELWAGRGLFEAAQSTVAVNAPNDAAWTKMRFMVFDVPASPLTFDTRKDEVASTVGAAKIDWLRAVPQFKVADEAALESLLKRVCADGAEGLALHRGASLYKGERSDDLLKFKMHDDAEATVVGVLEGKGKYRGMMGALVVESSSGLRFRLGSGFTDADRQAPPAVGSQVTYRYRGVSKTGVPRFATYLRVPLL